uniref:1-alkyl-2-acetylglycerophosphocholine esterase n=1 Tax=Astatotilapia calliptera TaxID=8154 RepID=A0AAX7TQ32_ASTCA
MSCCFTSIIWPKVILFGDSITQVSFQPNGWGAEIADKLARKCDVINRGLSGYNSRWGKIVLPRLINPENSADSKIEAVTIFFGANDSALEGTASLEPSIGLRSSDCGGRISSVNSLSCSTSQFETIWALWRSVCSFLSFLFLPDSSCTRCGLLLL